MSWELQNLPYTVDLESKAVLKQLAAAHKTLAELKGTAKSIPRAEILINTLALQEAKDSSAVENIVTTHDELYKSNLDLETVVSPATKEVQHYVNALKTGYQEVKSSMIISNRLILNVHEALEKNKAGFRKVPGTTLKNDRTGEVVYEPPQNHEDIKGLMRNLEAYINGQYQTDIDPLIKMAVIHFQFESIHPFYDGNGRTGRIINLLYLVMVQLLDLPILYLSRYIIRNKGMYYQRLQAVRDTESWEDWVLFMLKGVEETAIDTLKKVEEIKAAMMKMKHLLRNNYKFYSQDLLNHLFNHPYSKIEYLEKALGVSRVTASGYLNKLAKDGVLVKFKEGKTNYYVNQPLVNVLMD